MTIRPRSDRVDVKKTAPLPANEVDVVEDLSDSGPSVHCKHKEFLIHKVFCLVKIFEHIRKPKPILRIQEDSNCIFIMYSYIDSPIRTCDPSQFQEPRIREIGNVGEDGPAIDKVEKAILKGEMQRMWL
jgi:hypothetical protein